MTRFLAEPDIAAYCALFGSTVVKATVDDVLRAVRHAAVTGAADVPAFEELLRGVRIGLARLDGAELVEVLNATGVILHTNLGRAPLASEALRAMERVSGGYSNLEFDLVSGKRGTRYAHVTPLLRELTGAQDALVVNNCAAAMLLIFDTFARAREVVTARGELIEIGGGFRLPDVLARAGATLVEVGTTNKTYLRDFERALRPNTGLVLRSHTSNYRVEGFTASVPPRELAALGKRAGVTSVEDLGGGALVDLAPYGLPHERTVPEAVADGLDLVAFSGDKLLGGPQAGIVVGTAASIARLRANPLVRALRVDAATLAGLAATLRLSGTPSERAKIPLFAMLSATPATLESRAREVAARIGEAARATPTHAFAGGGSAPLAPIPSWGVACATGSRAEAAMSALRAATPPVIARVCEGELILDLRTIPAPRDEELVTAAIAAIA